MRYKFFLTSIVLNLLAALLFAQVTFYRSYSSGGNATAQIKQTSDGGFIALTNAFQPKLVKTNAIGDTLWIKYYDNQIAAVGNSVEETEEGGFVIIGTTFNAIYLLKTDDLGNVLWSKTYQSGIVSEGYSIKQTFDGGLLICGSVKNGIYYDVYILKTNSIGDTLWTKEIGEPNGSDEGREVLQTSDSGFIITADKAALNYQGILLIKTNSVGDTLWTTTLGGFGIYLEGGAICILPDQNYLLSSTNISDQIVSAKISMGGDLIWHKAYTALIQNAASDIEATFDQGFIIAGGTWDSSASSFDILILKEDSLGNVEWSKRFGHSGFETAYSVVQSSDNGYAICGIDSSSELLIIKTDSMGNSGGCYDISTAISTTSLPIQKIFPPIQISIPATVVANSNTTFLRGGNLQIYCSSVDIPNIQSYNNYDFYIYPNPSNDVFKIESNTDVRECHIYNIMGKEVRGDCFTENQIDLSAYPSGIYMYKITVGLAVTCGLLIKD